MKVAYPKHPRDIMVRIIHRNVEDGLQSSIKTTAEVPLNEKLDDYLLRLGYSNSHIMGIITQLMTKTKVRIDFRDYTERLELVDMGDQISSSQAASLLDDYISQTSGVDDSQDLNKTTQKIVVQLPKLFRPDGKK